MNNIMITGYSGNVGSALARYFDTQNINYIAGVRHIPTNQKTPEQVEFRHFDLAFLCKI